MMMTRNFMNKIDLWDYYAGQALAGMYANNHLTDNTELLTIKYVSESAAILADAMMAERAKRFPVEAEKPDLRNGWYAAPDWAVCRAKDKICGWGYFSKIPKYDKFYIVWIYEKDSKREKIPSWLEPDFDGDWRESLQVRPGI
jgi:hypothetical protein